MLDPTTRCASRYVEDVINTGMIRLHGNASS